LATQQLQLSVSTEGVVPQGARQRAEEKLGQLAGHIREPVLFAEVRLVNDINPIRVRPAIAEATLDINGTPIRAQVAAVDIDAAIDLLEDRLKRRITRHEERLHRGGKNRHRNGNGHAPDWRHGDRATHRPEWYDRPADEREVVRHKTFALEAMTIDEAAFDLDSLAHDFYLFTELETGCDALLSFDGDGLLLQLPEGVGGDVRIEHAVVTFRLGPAAPTLSLTAAEDRLDDGGERWVFFIDEQSGRGHVVYHRYDGHYGLITPAR
jgi:ribosomal subunit interface protein